MLLFHVYTPASGDRLRPFDTATILMLALAMKMQQRSLEHGKGVRMAEHASSSTSSDEERYDV